MSPGNALGDREGGAYRRFLARMAEAPEAAMTVAAASGDAAGILERAVLSLPNVGHVELCRVYHSSLPTNLPTSYLNRNRPIERTSKKTKALEREVKILRKMLGKVGRMRVTAAGWLNASNRLGISAAERACLETSRAVSCRCR